MSASASPICVSATLPTVPSPAIDTALPGISAPLHYEPVPYTESMPQIVPALCTTHTASTAPRPACIFMPATNIPIVGVPSIKPSSPIEAVPTAVLASPPVLLHTTTTAMSPTVQIPPALVSCCVDGDEGFSGQIVVY